MPRRVNNPPSYRLHKSDGRAVVTLDGRDIFLGKYGTPESRAEYDRLVGEWLANGRRLVAQNEAVSTDLSVNEVLLAFWRHAERHFRKPDGIPSGELDNYRDSLRALKRLYGETVARDFSPLKLKAVRQAMIDSGLSRTTVNQRVGRVVRTFKWAASEELVPAGVHQSLKTVTGLQEGRPGAKEPAPVGPVPEEAIEAIRPHVSRQVWAMIELQRFSGMRPGEVASMRSCDVETSGEVWAYTPSSHKTAHRKKRRAIYLGPRAQAVLRPWLRADRSEFLFSPREAMEAFRRRQRAERKSRLYPSQIARARKANPQQKPGDRYTTRSYCHAVGYGCRCAGIPSWHPHQLRHSAATNLRKEFGIEVARVILGHTSPAATEVYA